MDAKILLKYQNKWVALSSNRQIVLAYASNVKRLDKKIRELKIKDAIFHYVIPFNISLAP